MGTCGSREPDVGDWMERPGSNAARGMGDHMADPRTQAASHTLDRKSRPGACQPRTARGSESRYQHIDVGLETPDRRTEGLEAFGRNGHGTDDPFFDATASPRWWLKIARAAGRSDLGNPRVLRLGGLHQVTEARADERGKSRGLAWETACQCPRQAQLPQPKPSYVGNPLTHQLTQGCRHNPSVSTTELDPRDAPWLVLCWTRPQLPADVRSRSCPRRGAGRGADIGARQRARPSPFHLPRAKVSPRD